MFAKGMTRLPRPRKRWLLALPLLLALAGFVALALVLSGVNVSPRTFGVESMSGIGVMCPRHMAVGWWDRADNSIQVTVFPCPPYDTDNLYVSVSVWWRNQQRTRLCFDPHGVHC